MNSQSKNIVIHKERTNEVRLNKYISESGYCSRRQADRYVEEGVVKINGVIAVVGTKVQIGDQVHVNGEAIIKDDDLVYLALYKPKGITCTTDYTIRGNIADYVNYEKRIFPIGRLDKDSEGLIFMTNDGDIVNKILRAGNNHEKEYIVTVDYNITDKFIKTMAEGVFILDQMTKPCICEKISNKTFKIILTQGLNRQIRRMCEELGYEVIKLKRTRIMNVDLGDLNYGDYRDLTNHELATINNMIRDSNKHIN